MTNEQKHTPGPWRNPKIYNGSAATHLQWVIDSPRGDIYIDFGYGRGSKEQEANARLIAAAPELLEACKEALAHFDKYTPGIAIDCKDSLRMAIQKAEATR